VRPIRNIVERNVSDIFLVLSRNLSGKSEENNETPSQNTRHPGHILNLEFSDYEAEVPTIQLPCLMYLKMER